MRPRTSPRRAPSQKRAEDTVVVLLDATEIAMARHGFHGATTNHIAHAAGVSIGTLYHYFPSKEALVEAVVHRMWQRELDALEERASVLLGDAPLESAVRELVGSLVDLMAKQIDVYKQWYGEAPHLGQLELGLGMSERGTALVLTGLEKRRAEIAPPNLAFAADLMVKTALAVVRTAARDYPREVKTGELTSELTRMLVGYLRK
jgi:AcrR family transcriptional regulator